MPRRSFSERMTLSVWFIIAGAPPCTSERSPGRVTWGR